MRLNTRNSETINVWVFNSTWPTLRCTLWTHNCALCTFDIFILGFDSSDKKTNVHATERQPRWIYGKQERLQCSNMFIGCQINWKREREKTTSSQLRSCRKKTLEQSFDAIRFNVGNISNKLHEESSFIYFDEKNQSWLQLRAGSTKDTLKLTTMKKNTNKIYLKLKNLRMAIKQNVYEHYRAQRCCGIRQNKLKKIEFEPASL